jgi:hypothetical protein
VRIASRNYHCDIIVMSFDLPIPLVQRNSSERGLGVRRGVLESAVASLAIGKHLMLMAGLNNEGAAVAEMLADTAGDRGFCFGCLTLSPAAARLLTSADVIASQFGDDVWLVARGADETGIRRIGDYAQAIRSHGHWRALVVTELLYAEAVRALSSAARRRFAFVEL